MPVIDADKPVVSKISDEIVARLEAICGIDTGIISFQDVERTTRLSQYVPKHGLIVVTRGELVRVPELDYIGNPPAVAFQQTFMIRVHISPSEHDTTPIEFYEDAAEAWISTAIRTDETWHQFGGNAINAEIGAQQTMSDDGGYRGMAVPLDVTFRVSEGNLFEVRA